MNPRNDCTFESTFALDQLTRIALHYGEHQFALMLLPVFGPSTSLATYEQLQTSLRTGTLKNPVHRVVEQCPDIATFNSQTGTVDICLESIEKALNTPVDCAHLLMALLKAFGRYLHEHIRLQPADTRVEQPWDVGAQYLATSALFDSNIGDGTVYARFAQLERDENLVLDLGTLTPADFSPKAPIKEKLVPTFGFSAGRGEDNSHSFAHESIGDALKTAGFNDLQRKAIYFGNWLRDFSQLIDPKLVRAENAPKDFPSKLSRAALTDIVDLLALKEFSILQTTEEGRQHYTVTQQMLGVYCPSEHIDNPVTLDPEAIDPRTIDKDFEPLIRPGDPLTEVDPQRSMKRYIFTAEDYMRQKLTRATAAGPTPEGMRYFGEALHVLEDFFAHSNFAELSLRKIGHHQVLPWTTLQDCKHGLPVITGLFSGSDVLASVLEPLAKILFPTDGLKITLSKPGERSDTERMLEILLKEDESRLWHTALTSYLALRDQAAQTSWFNVVELVNQVVRLPFEAISQANNQFFQYLLKSIGDAVDDVQLITGQDPNTDPDTPPTHSQLAKDHDTHPFHELTAHLARYAVEQVGKEMYRYWYENQNGEPIARALNFFNHPNDNHELDDIVTAWASINDENIRKGSSYSELQKLREKLQEEERKTVQEHGDKYEGAPNSPSDILSTVYPFG